MRLELRVVKLMAMFSIKVGVKGNVMIACQIPSAKTLGRFYIPASSKDNYRLL